MTGKAKSFLAGMAGGLLLLAVAGPAAAEPWSIKGAESHITFTFYQQGEPKDGFFESWTGFIDFDPADPSTARIDISIDTPSIGTGNDQRDGTLRSAAFFDVARWPEARFTSTRVEKTGPDIYDAHGTLTMRDKTRNVVLPFELKLSPAEGRFRAHAKGAVTISRLDYDIGLGEWAGTGTVGEEVVIRIDISALSQ